MPRYFFDLHNDVDSLDDEGKDLPDLEAAKANALREAREMMQESVCNGHLDLRHHIDVRDESGNVPYVLHFEDAVEVRRGEQILSGRSVAA